MLEAEVGGLVGYRVRFDEKLSTKTRIKFVTDGMLLREAILDRVLSSYQVVILDEAHERSVNSDVLMALLKNIVKSGQATMKLVVMSATLDLVKLSRYFGADSIVQLEGRTHTIEIYNALQQQLDYLNATIACVLQIALFEKDGDVLVFLPGQEEIEEVQSVLADRVAYLQLRVLLLPLYANLPPQE